MAKRLTTETVINKSGKRINQGKLEVLKQKNFICLPEAATGDAPKDVIKIYEYGRSKRSNKKTWVKYIAKIGHKWYPNESITEHYLTQLGKSFEINIANSKVVFAEDKIRFLSEHFHSNDQSLEHGANILSRYLNEQDTIWLDEMDKDRSLKKEINIIDISKAIDHIFKNDSEFIQNDMVHMLLFDALTGNNDRHYYNWGIITHIKNKHHPYFSPIYDTARGLLWNFNDQKVIHLYSSLCKGNNKAFINYVNNSKPKIAIPHNSDCNHFELIEFLNKNDFIKLEHKQNWSNTGNLEKAIKILNKEFKHLFTEDRKFLIKEILTARFNKLRQILID